MQQHSCGCQHQKLLNRNVSHLNLQRLCLELPEDVVPNGSHLGKVEQHCRWQLHAEGIAQLGELQGAVGTVDYQRGIGPKRVVSVPSCPARTAAPKGSGELD